MTSHSPVPTRFISLDIHKHYLVAASVDAQQTQVFGPQRVPYPRLAAWIQRHLTATDAVVLETTTNTFQIHACLGVGRLKRSLFYLWSAVYNGLSCA